MLNSTSVYIITGQYQQPQQVQLAPSPQKSYQQGQIIATGNQMLPSNQVYQQPIAQQQQQQRIQFLPTSQK